MDKSWLLFVNEQGMHYLVCEKPDKRYYFRAKVFLKYYFKNRFNENVAQVKKPSFLYQLAGRSGSANDKHGADKQEDESEYKVMVDGSPIVLSWDELEGTSIYATCKDGNSIIAELRDGLRHNAEWWMV